MALANSAIKEAIKSGELVIESVIGFQPEEQISANSIDLSLGRYLYEFEITREFDETVKSGWGVEDSVNTVDMMTGDFSIPPRIVDLSKYHDGFRLSRYNFYLAVTNEFVGSDTLLFECHDKSSIGRMGLSTHFNAGFGDLGFYGHITLEIQPQIGAICYQNQLICQISLSRTEGEGNYKKNGRYSNTFTGEDPYPVLSKGVKILEPIK